MRGVDMTILSPLVSTVAGKRVSHVFTLENKGNVTAQYEFRYESTPDWRVELPGSPVELLPGERADVTVEVLVPSGAVAGTIHILTLFVDFVGGSTGRFGDPNTVRQASILVEREVPRSRYRRLPVRATLSMFDAKGRGTSYGLRTRSGGELSEESSLELYVDLVTGDRGTGSKKWRDQYVRLRYENRRGELILGDVNGRFPDVAYRVLSGRGVSVRTDAGRWTSRFFAAEDRAVESRSTWAGGIGRRFRGSLWVGADYIRRNYPEGVYEPANQRNMLVLSTEYKPNLDFRLLMEGATGYREDDTGRRSGRAGQIELEYRSTEVTTTARAYAGTEHYPGWTGNRDGVVSYACYKPARPIAFWLSGDGSRGGSTLGTDSPELLTARYRGGTRLTPENSPRLEMSVGGEMDRRGPGGSERNTERRNFMSAAWWPVGPAVFGLSGRWGESRNKRTGTNGPETEFGASMGGFFRAVRAALRWEKGSEWLPDSESNLTSNVMVGDLGWTSPSGVANFGVSMVSESYQQEKGGLAGWKRRTIRPRIDLRLFGGLSLRTESSLLFHQDEVGVECWQVDLTWSEANALPILWAPERGEVRALLFRDVNMDKVRGPMEPVVSGVTLTMNHEQAVSMADGLATWNAIPAGMQNLELNPASLPNGVVAMDDFPRAVQVVPGQSLDLEIPLNRSCSISGLLFIDSNHDGGRGEGETGLGEIRMVLSCGEREWIDCITGNDGAYRFNGLPPGNYRVDIADGWLPADWVTTGFPLPGYTAVPGAEIETVPVGVAPRRKPMILTYSNGEAIGVSDKLPVEVRTTFIGAKPVTKMSPESREVAFVTGGDEEFVDSVIQTETVHFFDEPESGQRLVKTYDGSTRKNDPRCSLRGFVFLDENGDSLYSRGEERAKDVRVFLVSGGAEVARIRADGRGGYLFSDIPAGLYTIRIDPESMPAGWNQKRPHGSIAEIGMGVDGVMPPIPLTRTERRIISTYHRGRPR